MVYLSSSRGLGCPHIWICCLGATAATKGSLDPWWFQAWKIWFKLYHASPRGKKRKNKTCFVWNHESECMHPRLQSRQCGHSTHPVLHFFTSKLTNRVGVLWCVSPLKKLGVLKPAFLSWHRWWQSFVPFSATATGWTGGLTIDWDDPFIFPFSRFSFVGRACPRSQGVCMAWGSQLISSVFDFFVCFFVI